MHKQVDVRGFVHNGLSVKYLGAASGVCVWGGREWGLPAVQTIVSLFGTGGGERVRGGDYDTTQCNCTIPHHHSSASEVTWGALIAVFLNQRGG